MVEVKKKVILKVTKRNKNGRPVAYQAIEVKQENIPRVNIEKENC